MPEPGDEVRQVLPERPLVHDGPGHALGHFHLGSGGEVPGLALRRAVPRSCKIGQERNKSLQFRIKEVLNARPLPLYR